MISPNKGSHSTVSFISKVVRPSFKYGQDFPQTPLANVVQKGIPRAHIYPFDIYFQLSSCKHVPEFSA